jgi:hypothetical protein
MGKTQSKALAERHGRGTAGEQQENGMGTALTGPLDDNSTVGYRNVVFWLFQL